MTLEDQDRPLPLNLISTKDLVEELQGRFDVFVASGLKVRKTDDLTFQFGIRGNGFDIIAMLEYLKIELVLKQIERSDSDGNGTTDFD